MFISMIFIRLEKVWYKPKINMWYTQKKFGIRHKKMWYKGQKKFGIRQILIVILIVIKITKVNLIINFEKAFH